MVCLRVQIIILILCHDALTSASDISGYRKERVNGQIVKIISDIYNVHCDSESFVPDPNDCTVFYRCVEGSKNKYNIYRFQCPTGAVFDAHRGVCNYARDTDLSRCTTRSEKQDDGNKDKDVYEDNEIPKPIFNTNHDRDYGYEPVVSNNVFDDYNQEAYPSSTVAHSTEIFTRKPQSMVDNEHDDNRCMSDGFMGDTKDCKKFYRCVSNLRGGYIRYEYVCNDGTIWDDSTQGCNHAWIARNLRCNNNMYNNDINKPNTDFGNKYNLSINTEQKQYNDKIQNSYNQPHNPPTQTTEKNIQSTLISSTKKSYTQPTLTSVQMQFSEEELGYGNSVSNTLTTESIKHELNDINGQNSKFNPAAEKYGRNMCLQNGFFGYPGDCKNFYRCVESSKGKYHRYDFSCSDGTVWDDRLKTCNFAWAVKNCGNFIPLVDVGTRDVTTSNVYPQPSTVPASTPFPSKDHFVYTTKVPKDEDSSTKLTTFSDNGFSVIPDSNLEECTANGLYGDKNNCQNFYRCIETTRGVYTKLGYKCGEGTLWDPSIQACNHAWAVKNCTDSMTNTQRVSEVMSTISLIQTTTQANTKLENESESQYNQVIDQFVSSTPNDINNIEIKRPFKCSSSGFIGDPNDCKKFYRCVENGNSGIFTQYVYICGENTVWDSSIESCNHEWAVKECGAVTSSQNNDELQHTTHGDESVPERTTTSKGTAIPDTSTSFSTTSSTPIYISSTHSFFHENTTDICKSEGFYPDQQDCQKFYRCVDGGKGQFIKYEYTCGEGSAWDESINSCNHMQYVKTCQNMNNGANEETQPTSSPQSETTTTITTTSSTTTEPLSVEDESEETVLSSNKCKMEGHFGNKDDCRKFYHCVDDGKAGFKMYEYSCGEDTIWDKDIKACNNPQDVEHPSCSLENDVSSTDVTKGSTSTISTEHYEHSSSQPTATTATFSSTSSYTTITTFTSQHGDEICSTEGYFGSSNDCKVFYRCADGGEGRYIKYEFTCGEETIWDQSILACNHPRDVKQPSCSNNNGKYSTIINNDTSYTSEYSSSKMSTTSTTATGISSTLPTTENTESNITEMITTTGKPYYQSTSSSVTKKPVDSSVCSEEGYFGSTDDCQKFYRCVDNDKNSFIKYEFMCGEGTIWDQDIIACNHPQDVEHPFCSLNTTSTEATSSEQQNDSTSSSTTKAPTSSSTNTQKSTTTTTTSTPANTSTTREMSTSTTKSSTSSSTSVINTSTTESTTMANNVNETTEGQEKGNFTCTKAGFYPNPYDCTKFYRCIDWYNNGTSFSIIHFDCGEGTIWDPSLGTCNHPQDVKHPSCSSNTTPTEATSTEQHIDSTSSTTTKAPTSSPMDTQTTTTTTTTSTPVTTSTTGEMSISTTKTSTSSTTSAISTSTTESTTMATNLNENTAGQEKGNFTCTKAGFYPNRYDCTKFYRCIDWYNNGTSFSIIHFDCGEGTIWDPSLGTCNHPQDVEHPSCSSNTTPTEATSTEQQIDSTSSTTTKAPTSSSTNTQTTTTTSTPATTSTTGEMSTSTTKSSTSSSTSAISTSTTESTTMPNNVNENTEGQEKGNFTCTKAGFYPNPYDCTKFYRCIDWYNNGTSFSIVHFDCGEGTIWDPSLDTCNYKDDVYPPRNCSGSDETQNNFNSSTSESSSTDTATTQSSTASTTRKPSITTSTTEQSSSTSTTQATTGMTSEKSTTTLTTDQSSSTSTTQVTTVITTSGPSTTASTTEQGSSTSNTEGTSSTQASTTTEQQTTGKSTTQKEVSSTEQSTTTSEATTTEHSTTPMDQTDKTTEESSTSEGTTQSSSTEQQTTSSTDSSTEGGKTTTETTQQTTESSTSSTSKDKCPQMDGGQNAYVCPTSFRRHPKYCNLFYQCAEDEESHDLKIALFHCPNNTIYDELKTQCVEESKSSKKCEGSLAQTHRTKRFSNEYADPVTVGTESYACPGVGYFIFERKPDCSQAMLKCIRSRSNEVVGYIFRCPEGYTFWSKSKQCERISRIKDCKRSNYPWKKRYDIPIETYNVSQY